MDNDFLISIFRYFAQYVPTAALERMMVSPDGSAEQGANETITEAIKNNKRADAEIDAYIFTANAALVADLMRNSAGTVLFVEYGKSVFDANGMALSIDVAVTIACPYNSSNKDNVNEFLMCNAMQNKLLQLLSQMKEDSDHGCSCGKFILPSEIQPVEPSAFYSHVGFTAFIKIQSPVLSAQSVTDYLNTASSYGSNPLSNYYTKSQSDARFAFKGDVPMIDDTTTSTDKVWSSDKTSREIAGNKPEWGSIRGDINEQEDLMRKLNRIKKIAF